MMAKKCQNADNWCKSDVEVTKTTFLYIIDNFSKCIEENGQKLVSSTFSAHKDEETKWVLWVYPKGDTAESQDYVSVFLKLQESDVEEVSTSFELAVINGKQEVYTRRESKSSTFKLETAKTWGWTKMIARSLLKKKGLLPNDRLTIYCEVKSDKRKIISGQRLEIKPKPKKSFIDDMTALFADMSDSDIEIVVKAKTFRAHKLILKTRSAVFAAMFKHPTKESQQNRVIIEDIDENVFAKLLRFMYTDRYEDEDIELNMKVLSAADKYNLDELKSICEQNIALQMNVKTVSDVLIISDNHSAEELKSKAMEFIKNGSLEVMKTTGWKKVMDRSDLLKLF